MSAKNFGSVKIMKAVRFIAVIGFLSSSLLASAAGLFAQDNQDQKSEQTSEKPQADKNAVKIEQIPGNLSTVNLQPSQERYRIGLHDVLEINVYKHPDLSQRGIRLDESGSIRLPRIDVPIAAVCKTENELSEEIIELYKKSYLRDPYVTVFVKEQNSQPLSVIGAVQKPGNFFTNRRLTLLELLSYAGGQDVDRAGTKVQVARVGGISGCNTEDESERAETGKVAFFKYKLADVLEGKTNPLMRPGDIVVVFETEQIYVTGNVVRPQAIQLKRSYTLTEAIAAAGGVLPASNKNRVKLSRQDATGSIKEEAVYNLSDIKNKKIPDPILQPNDIVEVPTDKAKDFTNNLVRALTGSVGNIFWRIP